MFEALIPAEWNSGVAAMDPLQFWMVTALTMAIVGVCFYLIFRFLYRARLINDTPTSRIRSAAQGYVELEGHGEQLPGEVVLAALTGTPCLWFSYKVEEREPETSGGSGQWRVICKGTSTRHFFLVDETGECLIDPARAEVIPSESDEWYGDSEQWVQGPAPRHGRAQNFATSRYRYTEQRIHPAARLHAIGWFTTDTRTGELPHAEQRLPHHLLSKPSDGRAFLLSAVPQQLLARRYRRYAWVSLFGFLLSGAVAGWLWSIHFTLR